MNTATAATDGRTIAVQFEHLRGLRRVVVAVLVLAASLSLCANVLVAQPTTVGRAVAAWPPIALIVTVDLISRVPAQRRGLSVTRQGAALVIAGIAAWLSYGHMVTLAERAGTDTASAHVIPLTVDGMAIVASLCLVELGTRLRHINTTTTALDQGSRAAGLVQPRPARLLNPTPKEATGTAVGPGEVVRTLALQHPAWTQAVLAERAGCSVRTVRRHLNTPATDPAAPSDAGLGIDSESEAAA